MKGTALVAVWSVLAAGCAADNARSDRTEARDYVRQDRLNVYHDFKRRCVDSGGYVVVNARNRFGRDADPGPDDTYVCRRGGLTGLGITSF